MRSKTDLLSDLRVMLRDVLAATAAGRAYARVARAHGYVDGFMRALMDTGVASKTELLEIVASERERLSGPAMRTLELNEPILGDASKADEAAA
jgi:hypothetical protein